jgi:hypothetical protein
VDAISDGSRQLGKKYDPVFHRGRWRGGAVDGPFPSLRSG